MLLRRPGAKLERADVPHREPDEGEVAIAVSACAICRTDLHVLDGELASPKLPLILGHEIVGEVTQSRSPDFHAGERVGVPWLAWTCGRCPYCRSGRENLCERAAFTGFTVDGGFAERTIADARYVFRLPDYASPAELAPLLCAGLIGYRSLRFAEDAHRIGIYGFGAAAHVITQVARHQHRDVYAMVRPGDEAAMSFACELGAVWAGPSDARPDVELDAAIVFAPAGELVPAALRAVRRGGIVVCGGIHMSDIPSFPYSILWGERVVRSVANLTRRDGEELLALAPRVPLRTRVTTFPLEAANEAIAALRIGCVYGAAVLTMH
jgi:propanol-preferring alcohol dehydrogenase